MNNKMKFNEINASFFVDMNNLVNFLKLKILTQSIVIRNR